MNLVEKMNLKNAVERVLHVPGNYTGGILEMTLAIDCALPQEPVRNMTSEIASALRSHSEVFRNVRLNLLYFLSDSRLENQVVPLSFLQMGRLQTGGSPQENVAWNGEEKSLDALTDHLKRFHARSKLILALVGEELVIKDEKTVFQNMQPFLGKKSLFLKMRDPEAGDGQTEFPEGDLPGEDAPQGDSDRIRRKEETAMRWVRGAELLGEWDR